VDAHGRYTIPVEHDADDFENQLNVAHDDAQMRKARVKRLLSGFSMSAAPPARTVRTVSRFVVTGEDESHIELRAAMVLVEYKYERTRVLAADVTYRLLREGDGGIKLTARSSASPIATMRSTASDICCERRTSPSSRAAAAALARPSRGPCMAQAIA
jgi:3-phenylpropionate/cinnamic acid dioxygenase small subunit